MSDMVIMEIIYQAIDNLSSTCMRVRGVLNLLPACHICSGVAHKLLFLVGVLLKL